MHLQACNHAPLNRPHAPDAPSGPGCGRILGELSRCLPPGRLRRAAMEDSIQLWLYNRRTSCWVGHLLACMQTAGVVTAAQLNACTTVHEVWALGITRRSVVTTLAAASAQVWAGMPADPRAIPATDPTPAPQHGPRSRADTGRVACTYASWVRAGAARAPHLGVPLPTQVHKILIKLRVTGAPKAVTSLVCLLSLGASP